MAAPRRIDAEKTKAELITRLRAIAAIDGTPLPLEDSAMHIANAYRSVRDPIVWLVDVPPSSDEGIAIARALGHLAAIEIMKAHFLAVGVAREGARDAIDALTRVQQANNQLRTLGQEHTPLFELEQAVETMLDGLKAAMERMPAGPSSLTTDADFEEAMLMNVTRELSKAFGPTEIGRLVDDRGERGGRWEMDRVRSRLAELDQWSNGAREVTYFPHGWQSPPGGT